MLQRIISGGQTGADRAALDAALETGFPCGGYCPKNREAEDGPIDDRYPLVEINGGYAERTRKNVEESDGTLIVFQSPIHGGTRLTRDYCIQCEKPCLLIDFITASPTQALEEVESFIHQYSINALNVAGPRASDCPEVYGYVHDLILKLCSDFRTV